jgi:hypothetical protein
MGHYIANMPPNQLHLPSFKDLVTFCKDDRVTVEASSLQVVRDASQGAHQTAFDRRCSDADKEARERHRFDQEQRGNQPSREPSVQSRTFPAIKEFDGRASQQVSQADHTDQVRPRFADLSGTLPRAIHTASSSSSSASTRSSEESARLSHLQYARSVPQVRPSDRRSELQSQQSNRSAAELKPSRGDTFMPPTPSTATRSDTRYVPQTIPSQRSLPYRSSAAMHPNGHLKQFEHAHQRHAQDHRVRSYSASPHAGSTDRGRSAPSSPPPYVARQTLVVPGSRSHPPPIAPKPTIARPATHDGARTFDLSSSAPMHRAQPAHARSGDHSVVGDPQTRTFEAQERMAPVRGGEHEPNRMHTVQHRQEVNGRGSLPDRKRYDDEIHRDTRMAGPPFSGFSATQSSSQQAHTEPSAQHHRVQPSHPSALDASPQLRYGTNGQITATAGPVRQYTETATDIAAKLESAPERDHPHRQCTSPCSPSCPRRGSVRHDPAHFHQASRERMPSQPQILRTQSEETRRLQARPAPQAVMRGTRDERDGIVGREAGFSDDGMYAMQRSNAPAGSQVQRRVLGGVSVRSQQARQPAAYAVSRNQMYQPYDASGGYASGVAVKRSSQGSIRRMSPPRLTRQGEMDTALCSSTTERPLPRSTGYAHGPSDNHEPAQFVRTQRLSTEQHRYSATHEAAGHERTYSTPQRGSEWSGDRSAARSSPHRPVIASQEIAPAAAMRDDGLQRNGSVAVQRPAKRLRAGSDTSLFRPARFAEQNADAERAGGHSLQSSPLTRPES